MLEKTCYNCGKHISGERCSCSAPVKYQKIHVLGCVIDNLHAGIQQKKKEIKDYEKSIKKYRKQMKKVANE